MGGARAVSVGKHGVVEGRCHCHPWSGWMPVQETTMLKTSLIKSKGRFDEEELRAVFAEHGMDVRSAKPLSVPWRVARRKGCSVSYISSVKKETNELSLR